MAFFHIDWNWWVAGYLSMRQNRIDAAKWRRKEFKDRSHHRVGACRVAFCLSSFLFRTYKNCLNHQIKYHNEYKKERRKESEGTLWSWWFFIIDQFIYIFFTETMMIVSRIGWKKQKQLNKLEGKKMKTKDSFSALFRDAQLKISRKLWGLDRHLDRADERDKKFLEIFILFSFRPFNPHDI